MTRLFYGPVLLGATLSLAAQAPKVASAAHPTSADPILKLYTSCHIAGGPDLVQTMPLPQAPMTRAAQTLTGPKKITIANGVLAAFAFSKGVPFANVKVEQLPAAVYTSEKATLLSEFDAINAKGEDTKRNYDLKPTLNGFDIYGFDRTSLDENHQLMGMYLFFDNAHHIETTAYFVNAPAAQRHFHNIGEYVSLRDGFLNAYTSCVRKALGGASTAAKPPTARRSATRAKHH